MSRGGFGRDDDGSVLLLALGYAVLCLALVFVAVDATSLYLAQKRADTIADAAALAGADGFVFEVGVAGPAVRLGDDEVRELAASVVEATDEATLIEASTTDGSSVTVTVATLWRPPIASLFVPDGVPLTASATSRTVLR